MPYHYILANLLASNADAVGVLFLDDTGETVDLACADYTPYQMRILGAYMGICLKQIGRLLGTMPWGQPEQVHVEKEGLHLYAMRLPDDYYLVLVQKRPALVGRARTTLAEAAAQLRDSLF